MTKFAVILENSPGVVLERRECEADSDDAIDDVATAVIESWVLSIGDTIKIVEA